MSKNYVSITLSLILRLALSHVLFSFSFAQLFKHLYIRFSVQKAALVETHNSQPQQHQPPGKQPTGSQSKTPINPSINLFSSFSESFISSGKQGDGGRGVTL
jgi:hypothetical protein